MKLSAIILVILATVIWFVPDRPIQALRALHDFSKALGPGSYPEPQEATPSEIVLRDKELA